MKTDSFGSISSEGVSSSGAELARVFLIPCSFFLFLSVFSFCFAGLPSGWGLLLEFLLTGAAEFLFIFGIKRTSVRVRQVISVIILSLSAVDSLQFFVPASKSLLWLILTVLLAFAICRLFSVSAAKSTVCASAGIGTLLAVSVYLGWQLQTYARLELLYIGKHVHYTAVRELLWLCGLAFLLSAGLLSFFSLFLRPGLSQTHIKTKKRDFFLIAALLLLCWLPYYLAFYPGFLSVDSLDEIKLQLSLGEGSNHHPYIHQLMILPFLKLGLSLGSLSFGVGCFTFVQMVFMACCFASSICFLREHGCRRWLLVCVFLFYAFFTVNPFYSITVWKDIPFAGVCLILMMRLIRDVERTDTADTKVRRRTGFLLVLLLFLFCTLRNNGWYAFLLSFPIFILINRRQWKRYLIIGVAAVLAVLAWQSVLYDILHIRKSESGEALSVPLQQIARVVTMCEYDSADESFTVLREVLPDLDTLPDLYNPISANPVKHPDVFKAEVYNKNPARYARAWLSIGLRYPRTYLDAFLLNNYGYWTPDVSSWIVLDEVNDGSALGIDTSERIPGMRGVLLQLHNRLSSQEPIAFLYSLALLVWFLLVGCSLLLLKGRKSEASSALLLGGVWLTTLASPVFCEYRYLYSIVVCVPLYLGLAICVGRKEVKTAGFEQADTDDGKSLRGGNPLAL